jgi:hypothetical protein
MFVVMRQPPRAFLGARQEAFGQDAYLGKSHADFGGAANGYRSCSSGRDG